MKNEKIPLSGRIERLVSAFGRKKDLEDRLRELGLSRSTLNRLEQGKQEIKADHLEKIALLEKECGFSTTSLDTSIACKHCKTQIPVSSWQCPRCGKKLPTVGKKGLILIMAAMMVTLSE
jgi:transcriptional regulator with XRE-family HTH domain